MSEEEELRLNLIEDMSNNLEVCVSNAANRISAYLEKTLNGIVPENSYCNDKAKARISDILTEDVYLAMVMKK